MVDRVESGGKGPSSGRVCLLVLGMHRSGTSALSRVLALLGADLPQALMPANRGNETGYWESAPISRLNDDLLASAGSGWADWLAFDSAWYGTPTANEIEARAQAALDTEFGASSFFVLKDPRICRIAPFWFDVLEAKGISPLVLMPLRNPLEVAASLEKRDGFPVEFGCLLWLRHVLEAEAASRGRPRLHCSYDELMSDWQGIAARVRAAFALDWPRAPAHAASEIDMFLTEELRHHREKSSSTAESPALSAWVHQVWSILGRWVVEGERPEDFAELDRIRMAFDDAVPVFAPMIDAGWEAARKAKASEQALNEAQVALHQALNKAEEEGRRASRAQAQTAAERAAREESEAGLRSALAQNEAEKKRASRAELQLADEKAARAKTEAALKSTLASYEEEKGRASRAERQAADEKAARAKAEAALKATLADYETEKERASKRQSETDAEKAKRKKVEKARENRFDEIALLTDLVGKRELAAHARAFIEAILDASQLPLLPAPFRLRRQMSRLRRSGLFDDEWYRRVNPDVAASRMDPMRHFVKHGFNENRAPNVWVFGGTTCDGKTLERKYGAGIESVSDRDVETLRNSEMFDAAWYLAQYPDVAKLGHDPVEHYLRFGARLHRNPSPAFDTRSYLDAHPDVADTGVNPLVHYELYGKQEGRICFRALEEESSSDPVIPSELKELEELAAGIRFPTVDEPEISVVIPVYNQLTYTLMCLDSLAGQECDFSFEVIVMDDCSTDRSPDVLPNVQGVRYFRNAENLGFNGNCNRGAELAQGRYIVFLNNDTKVLPGWLQTLRNTFDTHDMVGVVGSKLVYPDGSLQEAGGIIWEDASGWNWGRLQDPDHPRFNFVRDVDYVSGASLMIPRDLFFGLGKFSDALENSYYEDTWLAFAAREAGYRVLYQPRSELIHFEGITSGRDISEGHKRYQEVNRTAFLERWRHRLEQHLPNGTQPEKASDRTPKAHILIVDACTPTPDQDSGSLDMFNLIRILCMSEYRVHFFPFTNLASLGRYTEDLESLGVECIRSPYYSSIGEYLTERGDMFSHVIMARTPVASAVVDDIEALAPSACRIFYTVDMHGLREVREAELQGDDLMLAAAQETLRQEMELIERSDISVVLSSYEADFLEAEGRNNVEVLPLIRDYTPPTGLPDYDARQDVVFIGGFQHTPNLDAVRWLVDEIWPALRAMKHSHGGANIRLRIVGSNMPEWIKELAEEDIEPLGFVEDLDEIFLKSRLSVAPLRYGAGLKGKVATSLGYGVPTIGTSIAFEGMPVQGLEEIRLCEDSPEDIARLIVELYGDPQRWRQVSSHGIDYVHDHYSLHSVAPAVTRILDRGCAVAARRLAGQL